MPRAKLEITVPDSVWIGELSRNYPEAGFEILTVFPKDEDGAVALTEITADDLDDIVLEMDDYEEVTNTDYLQRTDETALVQFETDEPLLLLSIRNSRTPFEPPITIVDGVADLEITASRDRLSSLAEQFRTFGLQFDVQSVRTAIDSESVVTDGQRRLIETAVERGYYDTPRTCTLTELADHLGIAKSTASERLHRAEGAIIRAFVDEEASPEPKEKSA
jgi:predicted DNA binding protein